MVQLKLGTFSASLGMLHNQGVRYSTVIDLGCADGSFYLGYVHLGLLAGTVGVNVDANSLYEPSLKNIQEVLGGHYRIAAISDHDGEIELQTGSHAYWASTLSADASYWQGGMNRPGQILKVPAVTLDTLVRELALKPPFLLKLDVQGGELAAFRGGEQMLAETDTIICESEPVAFAAVYQFLARRNFRLFDFTEMSRSTDGTLLEFYPIFINERVKYQPAELAPQGAAPVISAMEQRRAVLLAENAKMLAEIRQARASGRTA